jgi:hypothetical protein
MPEILHSDIVIEVLIEETMGRAPSERTRDVPESFRQEVREEVREIKAAGGVVWIPYEMADPEPEEEA